MVFGNQGGLFANAMTWWDHSTGSLWSQPNGLAIDGPRSGDQLELLPSSLTTWAGWQAEHPDTLALAVLNPRSGFSLDQLAIVVSFGDEFKAYPFPRVQREQVVNSEVAGVPLAVVSFLGDDGWAIFSRRLDNEIIELEAGDDVVREVGGDRTWDAATGIGLGATDQNLDSLPSLTSFPRDYLRFFQNGVFWLPTGLVPVAGCTWDQGTDAWNLRGLVECGE